MVFGEDDVIQSRHALLISGASDGESARNQRVSFGKSSANDMRLEGSGAGSQLNSDLSASEAVSRILR